MFCDLLGETVERYGIRIHGFALMPNHYHLMVESVRGNLSRAMKYLGENYTQTKNREWNSNGSVFRGRFQNKLVTESSHWWYLLAYLHLNPVKARFVLRVDQWRWTSHRYYSGKQTEPDWLTTESLLKTFGGKTGYRSYLKEARQKKERMPYQFETVLFGTGAARHVAILKQEERSTQLDWKSALEQVLHTTKSEESECFREVKGRGGNPVRTVAAWWLAVGASFRNVDVCKILNMSEAAVSRALARVRHEIVRNPRGKIATWAFSLKKRYL